ncbi:hypothetical protein PUN4_230138 [Paraburkholderia unamae]|uniref:helix-turn-helix domain-containing protein n=1 Tax=Paraburkholderia unamae TaxID=219649 RepID=UPI001CAFCB9B|nr:helix-turn-helix domain-containing protein [Paraburkholderia unamae]CAG9255241.1 hypothetical protein PUN4_230138 [Paraburkholderia unamae]
MMPISSEESQQEFLREAMERLGLSRKEFAARLSVSLPTLHNWLQPSDSQNFRKLPPIARSYVTDILKWEA